MHGVDLQRRCDGHRLMTRTAARLGRALSNQPIVRVVRVARERTSSRSSTNITEYEQYRSYIVLLRAVVLERVIFEVHVHVVVVVAVVVQAADMSLPSMLHFHSGELNHGIEPVRGGCAAADDGGSAILRCPALTARITCLNSLFRQAVEQVAVVESAIDAIVGEQPRPWTPDQ